MDNSRPSLAIGIKSVHSSFLEAKRRGVKLRYLTELTYQNISSCKTVMEIVDELRHLDGLKGNFMVSEKEYLSPSFPPDNTKPASRLFYSNFKDIVEQNSYFFETLWKRSIPAKYKIREIEEGTIPIRTKLLEDPDEITKEIMALNNRASRLSICSVFGGMQMSYKHFFDSYNKLLDKYGEGKDHVIRWLVNIDNNKDNIALVKIFLDAGINVRHIGSLPPMSFGLSDKEIAATIEKNGGR